MPVNHSITRRRLALQLAVTLWSGLLAGGWLLAARAASGELALPLQPEAAWTATLSAAALGLLAALLFRHSRSGSRPNTSPLVATLTLAPTLVSGFTLLDLSNNASWLGLTALALAVSLTLYAGCLVPARRRQQQPGPLASSHAATPVPGRSRQPTHLSQNLRRHRDQTGDRLEGDLTMHWESGQRQQPVHVPFVPAFEGKPEVTCRCEEDDEAGDGVRARVAEVQRFGTRIELRRSGNLDTRQVTRLELSVTLDDSARRAA
jgi:hypothetical protein